MILFLAQRVEYQENPAWFNWACAIVLVVIAVWVGFHALKIQRAIRRCRGKPPDDE